MEFNKTGWSCSWNSDQICIQNSAGGRDDLEMVGGPGGGKVKGVDSLMAI